MRITVLQKFYFVLVLFRFFPLGNIVLSYKLHNVDKVFRRLLQDTVKMYYFGLKQVTIPTVTVLSGVKFDGNSVSEWINCETDR
jgi:hypothetical protein